MNAEVTTSWIFELRVLKRPDAPFYVTKRFMQEEQYHQQTHNNDTFNRKNVSEAQFCSSTEEYSDSGIGCDYSDHVISQAYGEVVFCL